MNKALRILRGFPQRLELNCFDFLVSKAVKVQILGTHSKAIHIFPFNVVYCVPYFNCPTVIIEVY